MAGDMDMQTTNSVYNTIDETDNSYTGANKKKRKLSIKKEAKFTKRQTFLTTELREMPLPYAYEGHAVNQPGYNTTVGRTACALRQRKARPTGPLAAHTPRSGADLRAGAAPALRWEGALRPLLAPPTAPGGAGGRPLPLKSAFGAGGRSAAESPRPGAAQRLAAPPPPGPHPPAPIPLRWTLSRAGGRGSRAPPLPPGAPAHPRLPRGGRGGHLRLLSPPSVNHSWSPGEEGRPGDARPFKGAARLFGAPASSLRLRAGHARHQRIASSEGTRSWLYFTIVLLPVGPLVSKLSFRASFEIPWVCLQIWPILGVVAFKINTHQRLILSDNSRTFNIKAKTCKPQGENASWIFITIYKFKREPVLDSLGEIKNQSKESIQLPPEGLEFANPTLGQRTRAPLQAINRQEKTHIKFQSRSFKRNICIHMAFTKILVAQATAWLDFGLPIETRKHQVRKHLNSIGVAH
ncbi:hypothetical protein EI555_007557, partial [Monodon monoceros]